MKKKTQKGPIVIQNNNEFRSSGNITAVLKRYKKSKKTFSTDSFVIPNKILLCLVLRILKNSTMALNDSLKSGHHGYQEEIKINHYIQDLKTVILEYIFPAILSLSAASNFLIIVYFLKVNTKKLRKTSPYHFLLIQLAVADFLVCVGMAVMEYFKIRPSWEIGEIGCRLFVVFQGVCPMASYWILVLLSFARFRRITQPFKQRISKKKYSLACMLIWMLSFAVLAFQMSIMVLKKINRKTKCHYNISTSSFLMFNAVQLLFDSIIPAILIVYFYWKIKSKMVEEMSITTFTTTNQSRQRNQTALRTIKSLVILFIVSIVPARLIHILSTILNYYIKTHRPLFSLTMENYVSMLRVISTLFIFLNHMLNIFIYAKTMPGFRRFLLCALTLGIRNAKAN